MPTIEITLHADYVPQWGTWEGIREIVQNAVDGERQHSAKMTVRHRASSDTLIVRNDGARIPREALLIGFTTKANRSDLSGQFGEGLNLGILALVRAGHALTVRSGDEIWKPCIERSEKFSADVLKVRISKASRNLDAVQVEIGGITADAWEEMRKLFLFLAPPTNSIKTDSGTLLLDEEYRGQIFVKGIFVDRMPKVERGYDLIDAKLDRDRRMVEIENLRWNLAYVLNAAARAEKRIAGDVYEMLQLESEDVANMQYCSNAPVEELARIFEAKEGKGTVPVRCLSESRDRSPRRALRHRAARHRGDPGEEIRLV